MRTIDPATSTLLLVDFQAKLMPVIVEADVAIANARRLVQAAALLDVPAVYTEQNPKKLGATVAELVPPPRAVVSKVVFDACRAPDFVRQLPRNGAVVIAGCEAHVCVLQTALGLLDAGRHIYVVRDAIGSRRADSKDTALRRM